MKQFDYPDKYVAQVAEALMDSKLSWQYTAVDRLIWLSEARTMLDLYNTRCVEMGFTTLFPEVPSHMSWSASTAGARDNDAQSLLAIYTRGRDDPKSAAAAYRKMVEEDGEP